VSRQECIEKIAASINYVHSQTANVITGTTRSPRDMLCMILYLSTVGNIRVSSFVIGARAGPA